MKIAGDVARRLVRREAEHAPRGASGRLWVERVEHLSRLCAEGISSTHIAFLGTSILAKASKPAVDLFAIKPKHATGNVRAYSARSLCHSVLVPLAAELGINIGVTGREPLNNQPYFRMTYLGDGTPVHSGARTAFDYMVSLVTELQTTDDPAEIVQALRAFITVRKAHQPRYELRTHVVSTTPHQLAATIAAFVVKDSEHGRRAQAAVAALFDVFAGSDNVQSGRINDPSRTYPGDVCVRGVDGKWEKAVEVRDKPVAPSDVHIFVKKCVEMGVQDAAIVLASPRQSKLDDSGLHAWAHGFGIGLTLFYGWQQIVEQCMFWSTLPKPDAAIQVAIRIEARLLAVEASPESVASWQRLTKSA